MFKETNPLFIFESEGCSSAKQNNASCAELRPGTYMKSVPSGTAGTPRYILPGWISSHVKSRTKAPSPDGGETARFSELWGVPLSGRDADG